eukprot:m.91301 g.91301  ORF g.91301 m.91301 type:complete len:558 (-) comp26456_c0_seq6:254-1927(-)
MFRTTSLVAIATVCSVAFAEDGFGMPLIGTDAMKNLHLNSSQRVLVNGNDLMSTVELIRDMTNEVKSLRKRLAKHRNTQSPTTPTPSSSPTMPAPTNSPTTPVPTGPPTDFSIVYAGVTYNTAGQSFLISSADVGRTVAELKAYGKGEVELTAAGARAGRGKWSGNDDDGAPGGIISAKFLFDYDSQVGQSLYAFVSEDGASEWGSAGAGGGSTDLREVFTMPADSTGADAAFLDAFLETTSLDSRLIAAGGGGGPHGGSYGYWGAGAAKEPGAGGPDRACTDSQTSNDGNIVDTGASATDFGRDGGSSVDARYTGDGAYGMGGQSADGSQYGLFISGRYNNWNYTGMTWPNGGSGNQWAAGGGGGGWYGGAGNWPNGGGGSNNAPTATEIISNDCATNDAAGWIRVTISGPVPSTETPVTETPVTTTAGVVDTCFYAGTTTWAQSCTSTSTDDLQDAAMKVACEGAYPGSYSASYMQLVEGKIQGLPTSNPTTQWLVFSLPEPDVCNGHRADHSTCEPRNCVGGGAAFPTTCGLDVGWTYDCHTSTRSTVCCTPAP